jgi:4-alpha-methyl-delta7-sterol-4alpha-methyl oxidase
LTGEIAHPVEFVINFLLPVMAGPVLVGSLYPNGCHVISLWLWMSFRALRSTDAHSGYQLPFHPLRLLSPIYAGPIGHDFHHILAGRSSNFGGYKFWDWLMGTDKKYHIYLQKRQAKQQ